jgi:hypothetical protein
LSDDISISRRSPAGNFKPQHCPYSGTKRPPPSFRGTYHAPFTATAVVSRLLQSDLRFWMATASLYTKAERSARLPLRDLVNNPPFRHSEHVHRPIHHAESLNNTHNVILTTCILQSVSSNCLCLTTHSHTHSGGKACRHGLMHKKGLSLNPSQAPSTRKQMKHPFHSEYSRRTIVGTAQISALKMENLIATRFT